MVQVDVFWSYAIGAGFATAAARRIHRVKLEGQSAFDTRAFRDTLLYLAVLFAPSGVCLLWQFTSWETMHAGTRDLPGWLVTLFAVTNITQGILGFAIAQMFIGKGKPYYAFLQWLLGYFFMFFILIHGWDGTGYIRFFSAAPEWIPTWTSARVLDWLASDVAIALDIMGVFIIPVMLWLMTRDLRDGAERPKPIWALSAGILGICVILMPVSALLLSLAIRGLGAVVGTLVFVPLAYVLLVRRGGLYHRIYQAMTGDAPTPTMDAALVPSRG